MRSWKPHVIAAAIVCSVMAFATQAAIVITGTRVIYPAQSREVDVRMSNIENRPVLVQAWLDDGDAAAKPNEIRVPFVLVPAVFRVEPLKGQSLRIMFAGGDMPTDRESVYWLNVLEIPPKPTDADAKNLLQIALRTRIKMFYRPASLHDDPASIVVRKHLKWSVVLDQKGETVLRMNNPSPYYISLGSVSLGDGSKKVTLRADMAPPFGHVDLVPEKGKLSVPNSPTVSYSVLSDYGADVKDTAILGGAGEAETSKQPDSVPEKDKTDVRDSEAGSSPGSMDSGAEVKGAAQVSDAGNAKQAE